MHNQTSTEIASGPVIESSEGEEGKVVVLDTSHLKSHVWKYYDRLKKRYSDGTVKVVARCKHCKIEKPSNSNLNGTTSLDSHLKICKGGPLYQEKRRVDPSQLCLKLDKASGEVKRHEFNQKRCEMVVYRWVIKDEHSFRVVEGEGFKEMMYEVCPRFVIPHRKRVVAGVFSLFLEEKEKMKKVISDSRVSITTDTWTSIQNINYMVVTAHYLDIDWMLCKKIISFQKITSHKGDDIGISLKKVLNDWGIDKVFSITVDNATANDGAVEYVSMVLSDMNTLLANGEYLHLRCTCHILNLIVKDGLRELQPSIEGIRNCVKFIHSSPSRLDTFRDYCKLMKLGEMANVPMDVTTRWNSTYKILVGAFKYKTVFNRMARENGPFKSYFNELVKDGKDKEERNAKRVGPPKENDWDMASGFVTFLEKFYTLTLLFSGTKAITSHRIFYEVSSLQRCIEKQINDVDDPKLREVAKKMKPKFDKYWGCFEDVNKLIFVAHVLDPRYKLQVIQVAYTKLAHTPERVSYMCKEVEKCLLSLFYAYKEEEVGDQPREDHMEIETETHATNGDKDDLLLELLRARKRENTMVIRNEVDKYLTDPYESPLDKSFNLLTFWKLSHQRFLILSKVAKDIFVIPSSTVASESAFSLGRRIIDPFRASLTPRMVEALVCTNDWLRGEQFDVYKEPTDEELEIYKECEAVEATVAASGVATAASGVAAA